MTDARPHTQARTHAIAVLLGTYASAIALAPNRSLQLILVAPLVAIPVFLWVLAGPQRWPIAFLCAALVLPPLPIPMGDSGPHSCLAIAALGFFVSLLRMNQWRLRVESLHIGMLAYVGVLAASVAFAAVYSGLQIALASLARVVLFAISIFIFYYTAYGPGSGERGDSKLFRIVFAAGVVSALFACIDFYFQLPAPAGFGPQFVWLESGVYRRAQGVFYEASTLGNLCAFFLVTIAVSLAGLGSAAGKRPLSRAALLAGTVVFTSALMLSYSRASLVNVIVSILMLLFLQRQRIGLRRLLLLPSVALGAAAVAGYFLFPRFSAFYWERLSASVLYFFTATEGILSGRLESWSVLVRFLSDHPWHAVFGVGYKTLPYSDFIGRPIIADNAYLSALVETGVIGLAAMLLFNFTVLGIAWRAMRGRDPKQAFFGTCVFCFWVGEMFQMMSGDLLTYWRVLPVYLWTLGMAARRRGLEPSSA
jgi:hypothetical protein